MGAPVKQKKSDEDITVCPDCGSQDIEVANWVRANTNEIMGSVEAVDLWCPVCSEPFRNPISLAEYKEKEVDDD